MTILSQVFEYIFFISLEEVPITNDGLFVKTRSGKGGDGDDFKEIEDVDISLKRKAASLFDEMIREDEKEDEMLRKKQKLQNVGIYWIYSLNVW